MGDYYSVQGVVIHGAKKGRTIGYPTANMNTLDYLIPKNGVYATLTKVDGVWYQSMSSVGHNPTLNCMVEVSVESHIFDFDQDLYGKNIELKFIKRLRDELKFDSVEALIAQIDQDQIDSLKILNNAFVVEKDSFGIDNYNQMKGIDLFGNFRDNELEKIRLDRNTEMIYFLYDEETKELIGIDKAICSSILMTITNNKIDEIIFYTNPEGKVYPEKELEINEKILNGFNWRIDEKILNKKNLINN